MSRLTLKLLNDFLYREIQIGGCSDSDVFCMKRDGREKAPKTEQPFHSRPKNTQQTRAPTTLIESPQIISLLNRTFRSTEAAAFAMHRAPSVECGDTSTR